MAKVTSKATKESFKIYIDGHLHVAVPTTIRAVNSYIDKFKVYLYHIEVIIAKGIKMKLEYEEKKVWEAVLKEFDRVL